MKLFGINISRAQTLAEPSAKKPRRKLSSELLRERRLDITVAMDEFLQAVLLAKDIERPNRQPLYEIYEKIIERDAHLRSQLRTAKFTVLQSKYTVTQNGVESDELKKLFEASWFGDFLEFVIDQEFWGHSLIEFGQLENGRFKEVSLIDRHHVIPEFQSVLLRTSDDITAAVPYADNLMPWFLIEIGAKRDLGLLLTACVEIIYKKDARGDWSSFNERFGMPLLSVNTDTSNEAELDELENMAKNFGANGYVIGSSQTEFDIKQATGTENGHKKYQDMAYDCDDYISKLINGQTATSDNQAYTGTSEVQERILNNYTLGRLTYIQRSINDKLIPFLQLYGYPLENCKLEFNDLLEKKSGAQIAPDEKKKPETEQNGYNDLISLYEPFQESLNELAQNSKFDSIFEKLIKKIHALAQKNDLPERVIELPESKDLIAATASVYEKAINVGLNGISEMPDNIFLNKLTKSVWVFSGFKTERQLLDIASTLSDAEGKILPFNIFRDKVLKTHRDYNVNWLNAEYNMAVSASQTAAKWNRYEKDGDKYYLQYRSAGDERVRDSHAVLDGVTLPPSHDFWSEHYPPNGWGCRCTVMQVLKSKYEPTSRQDVDTKTENFFSDRDKIFAYNPGKGEAIFPPKHPYYNNSKMSYENMSNYISRLKNKAEYESHGEEWKKDFFDDKTGGFYVSHIGHSFDKRTGKFEKEAAKVLAQNGYKVVLQNETGGVDGVKIPDGFLDDILMEIKAIESNTASSISRNLENAARKKVKIAILFFTDKYDEPTYKLALDKWRGISDKENMKVKIIKIWGGKIIK